MLDKNQLIISIISALSQLLAIAKEGAENAHAGAINEQSVAETQYDTLGLESAYLAEGLGRRVVMYHQEMNAYKQLVLREFGPDDAIKVGALVQLGNNEGVVQTLFFGPCSGGLIITLAGQKVTVLTPNAPLGAALVGKYLDDEVSIIVAGKKQTWSIDKVY